MGTRAAKPAKKTKPKPRKVAKEKAKPGYRTIKPSAGTPSVPRSKIRAAVRRVTAAIPPLPPPPEQSDLDNNDWLNAFSTIVKLPGLRKGRVAFISDVHIPNQLKMEFEMAVCQIEEMRPDIVILGGDILDFHSVASFGYDPYRRNQLLQYEFDVARPYVERLTRAAKREAHAVLGNHCNRLSKVLSLNYGMWGLEALNMHQLAGWPKSLKIHPYLTQLQIGGMTYTHGSIANSNTAKATFAKYGKSFTAGHSHHMELLHMRHGDKDHQVVISGTYQDRQQARFCDAPNWQTAHVIVDYDTVGGESVFHARHAFFVGDNLCFDGKFTPPTAKQRALRG